VAPRQKPTRHHVRRTLSHGVTKGVRAQNFAHSLIDMDGARSSVILVKEQHYIFSR
jgi:hypothetical protein